jgi:hypothetical protein
MADKKSDPVEMWQAMLGEMEKGFNAFASHAVASPEVSKVVHRVGDASAGAQKQLGEIMETYLAGMNLPSRSQLTQFDERLQAIERRLVDITLLLQSAGAPGASSAAKPAPKRRPSTTARIKPEKAT